MQNSSHYSEKGKKFFKEGYNCAQAVFCAFAEEIGMNFETALKISSSFGGGMGRLREVCGAVSAMFMIAGIKFGYAVPNDDKIKAEHYTRIQELAERFKNKNNSLICRELLKLDVQSDSPIPSKRTEQYYKTRPCEELVADACEIMADYIKELETCKL